MARPTVCKVEGTTRVRPQLTEPKKRISSFSEAQQTLTLEQAVAEARRCTAATACLYCEVCQLLCPDLAITRSKDTGDVIIDLEYCKGCGLCAHYCPHGAIQMIVDE